LLSWRCSLKLCSATCAMIARSECSCVPFATANFCLLPRHATPKCHQVFSTQGCKHLALHKAHESGCCDVTLTILSEARCALGSTNQHPLLLSCVRAGNVVM
jgi:hypothetical protein